MRSQLIFIASLLLFAISTQVSSGVSKSTISFTAIIQASKSSAIWFL